MMKIILFCEHTHKRKKENNIAITNSIIIACSGAVKQQGRAANGPFGLHVKQPPREDENMIKNEQRIIFIESGKM